MHDKKILMLYSSYDERIQRKENAQYRKRRTIDDGLSVMRSASGSSLDRYRKNFSTLFQDNELKITAKAGKTTINFLDINLCLNSESYQPYRKPNDEQLYINRNSNHPPTILFRLPQTISKRMSSLSSNFELFSRAAPIYNAAQFTKTELYP